MLKGKFSLSCIICFLAVILIISGCNLFQEKPKNDSSSPDNHSDTTPPVITLITPTAGTIYNGQVLISGTASDESGIKDVWVKTGTNNYLLADGKENWNYIYHGGQVIDGEMMNISIKAFDNSGNSSDIGITLYFSTTNIATLTNYTLLTNYSVLTNYISITTNITNNIVYITTNYITNLYYQTNITYLTNYTLQTNYSIMTNYIEATNSIYITNVTTNIVNLTNISYSFSELMDEAVDNPGLSFTYGGAELWTLDYAVFHNGGDSAKSGSIGNSSSTYIQTVITNNFISFYWKVSSEPGWGKLNCYVDGNLKASITGEVDWKYTNFVFLPGTHTIKWMYTKDWYGASGSDCGWVDFVTVSNYVDTVSPEMNISFPTNNYQTYTDFTVSGSANDISELTGVYLSVDGSSFGTVNGKSEWNTNLTLTAGNHTLHIFAMDMFGNCTHTNDISVTKLVDTTPPSIYTEFPTNNYKTFGTIAVSGSATDDVCLSGIYLGVDSGSFKPVQGTSNWFTNLVLSGGNHTIKIYAMDIFSNCSTTNSINVTKKSVSGSTVYVSTGGNDEDNDGSKTQPLKSLQLAIDAINGSTATNVYVQSGVYTAGNGISNINNSGVYIYNDNINLSGGWDAGFNSQTGFSELEGNGTLDHIIYANNVDNLIFSGFVVRKGQAVSGYGGGICFDGVNNSLITNSIITDNNASYYSLNGGAGIYVKGDNNIINAFVADNTGPVDFGSGLYVSGNNNIIRGSYINNSGAQWGGGIAIYSGSGNIITSCTISNNNSDRGGGIVIESSSGNMVKNTTVNNNKANCYVGGILVRTGSDNLITNCVIKYNNGYGSSQEGGGGVGLLEGSGFNILDSVIYGNTYGSAGVGGGAIWILGVYDSKIINTVITNNYSDGIDSLISLDARVRRITNLIISNCTIGGTNNASSYALYEVNGDLTGQYIMDNTFITNTIGYLYYDYYGVNIITNDDSWTNINLPAYTGSYSAADNSVIFK